ncbi:MAG TPA: hypothetical protein VNF47_00355 [Streptosporangiaceae bacterium]|nr:hypothetical protein [Streptosporangiaceae bacterium]
MSGRQAVPGGRKSRYRHPWPGCGTVARLAGIAGAISYRYMHVLAEAHGQPPIDSVLRHG